MKLLKITFWTLGLLSMLALLLIIFPSPLGAQGKCQISQEIYFEHEMLPKLDSLRTTYGKHLEMENTEYELPLLIALSHYPELKDTKIKLVYKNTSTPLYARPAAGNFLRSKKNKAYRILVDRKSAHVRGKSLNAQVGVFAHELGHIVFYKDRGLFGIASYGLNYAVSKKYRYRDEKGRDNMVIDHGLGWQIHHFYQLYTHPLDMLDYMLANDCGDKELLSFLEMKNKMILNKEFDKALSSYPVFLKKRPELRQILTSEFYTSIALALYYIKENPFDIDKALKFTEESLAIFPNSPFIHHLLADLYAAQGKHTEAIEALEKAAMLNPGDRRSHIFIPIFSKRRDKKDE